jgi:outer membrane protein assembly factor BamE
MRAAIGLIVVLTFLIQTACSLPRVHRVTVQQGNVITQRMIDQLRPGMTRSQVAFVMGEPIFRNTFNDDRWDYLYSLEIPGTFREQKRLTIYFENDLMTHFSGDFTPTVITEPDVPAEVVEEA